MRLQNKKISEFLTEEEIQALLRVPNRQTLQGKRDYAILLTLLTTGLRKSELVSLRIGDIKPYRDGFALEIIGKGGKTRRVGLNPQTCSALKAYWKAAGVNGEDLDRPLFYTLGKHGPHKIKPFTTVALDYLIRESARKALIRKRVTPHTTRHTYATTLLDRGKDLKTVQLLMGHRSIETTERYLHSSDDKMMDAANCLVF